MLKFNDFLRAILHFSSSHYNYIVCPHRKEVFILLQSSVIFSILYAIFVFSIPLYMFIIFSSYTVFGGELTPRKLFVTLSLIVNLRLACHYVVLGLYGLSDSAVSSKRIKVVNIGIIIVH